MIPPRPFLKIEEAGAGEEQVTVTELSRRPNVHNHWRAICWTTCSSTAVYTTKRLMVIHSYHYPLTIAFRSSAATLIAYIVLLQIQSIWNNTPGYKRRGWVMGVPDRNDFLANRHWGPMIPAALAAAVSLSMLLEGLLHMPSLAVLVMLSPLVYTTESFVLFASCFLSRSRLSIPWETILSTAASSVILYNENRLLVPGLIFGVGGILLIGVSRAFFIIGADRVGSDRTLQSRLKAYHGFVIMTLLFSLLFSGLGWHHFENVGSRSPRGTSTVALTLVNMGSIMGTMFSGSSFMAYSPMSFADSTLQCSHTALRGPSFLAPFTASLLVLLASIVSSPASSISIFQPLAYLVASLCIFGGEQAQQYVFRLVDSIHGRMIVCTGREMEAPRKISRMLSTSVMLSFLLLFSVVISSFANSAINSLPPSLPTNFDTTFFPPNRFDIVVAMYQENPASVKSMLTAVKNTALLSTLNPRVIIYTKDPDQDLHQLKLDTGADIVERLDNLGREGGTYLWHIVNKWDDLAQQTMFIQAHAHNMRELMPRINSYLVPETGMLSLGFTGVTCDCHDCSDRWGWEDKENVIPALYEKIYSRTCESDKKILLSYKGQFVASARRIRGIDRNIFGGLLETISGKAGWSNKANASDVTGVGSEEESESNPYFGFAMERIWGLVMQCGTDAQVAARCPSLLSRMGIGGKVEDCQCLDDPVT